MKRFKSLFVAAVLVAFGTSAFAADATVTFVSGKVEVQRNGKWIALQKGDSVAQSETISTGFQSEAKLKLMESVLYLGPVTRVTLEELSTQEQTDNVNVYLKTGTTRSQVRHVDNKRVNYQVHTAVAVASCRGTDWIADDSNNFDGLDGEFAVNALADAAPSSSGLPLTGVIVRGNQSVQVPEDGSAIPSATSNVTQAAAAVVNAISSSGSKEGVGGVGLAAVPDAGASSGTVFTAPKPKTQTASVVVTLEIPAE